MGTGFSNHFGEQFQKDAVLVSGFTAFVRTERRFVKRKKTCGFVWTWLKTVRFSAGLNKGENIYVVRYVVVEKVAGSAP